jgi:hypothetical protein
LRHGREREVLVTLNLAVEAAGVLLGEKALGSDDEKIDVEADSADGDEQDQELVAQNPLQTDIVSAQQAIEGVLGEAIGAAVFAVIVL